jgi:lysophospholipase L1-like esterase
MTNPFLSLAKMFGYKEPVPMTHWQDKVIKFATTKTAKNQILFLGDSITEGWATTKFLKGYVNYGVAGDMTVGTLGLINLIEKIEPSRVIINIGTNDIGFGVAPSITMAEYKSLTKALAALVGEKDVICCAIRPVNNALPMAMTRTNPVIKQYNTMIQAICNGNGYQFEPETFTCHLAGGVLNPAHTVDGLHLSPLGYQKEFEIIQKYLSFGNIWYRPA